ELLRALAERLSALNAFGEKDLEAVFLGVMEAFKIKLGKIAQPLRVALTGTTVSPGIFEIMVVLGKERVLGRLAQAMEYIGTR
ncbi:MAG: glutamate--tRNA ligase, partial [Desulfatitalea sp.]|nr:glutamate--tRNA ligase [Desulfatitalea sp.]